MFGENIIVMFSSSGGKVWMDTVMRVGVVTASVATSSIQRGKIKHIKEILLLKVRHGMQFSILYKQV